MSYEEYLKERLERARETDYFDADGNSCLATANRGFIAQIKSDINCFNYDIAHCIEWRELLIQVINLLMIASLPITYVPFLISRAFFSKRKAKQEIMKDYIKSQLKEDKS